MVVNTKEKRIYVYNEIEQDFTPRLCVVVIVRKWKPYIQAPFVISELIL